MTGNTRPNMNDIHEAQQRIAPHIHRTPVMTSASLDEISGARLFFKCENFQRTGSFKMRGATNAVFSLERRGCCEGSGRSILREPWSGISGRGCARNGISRHG